MGFFDKLKQTFNIGGVHIDMDSPVSASLQDTNLPVGLTFTTKSPQTVNSIRLKLIGVEQARTVGQAQNTATPRVFAQTDSTDSFAIQPGETKKVELTLALNVGAAMAEALPDDNPLQQMAGVLQRAETLISALDQKRYNYFVEVVADVEGATFDPSARKPIIITKPGQMSTGFNVQP
jgi:hypothetical protein